MSQGNQITLCGYVTAEPRFRMTNQTATPYAQIRVGCTPRRLNRATGEWQDEPTSYYTVKVWRRLAINASSSLHKGDMVVVRGRFYTREWVDSQQQPRWTLEIEADSVGHDLSYGWSHFLRGTRPQPGSQAALNAGERARQDLGETGDGESDFDGEFPPGGDWDEAAEALPARNDTEGVPGAEEIPVADELAPGVSEPAPVPLPV